MEPHTDLNLPSGSVSIVVFGASGDLARKKTFPALFSLYRNSFLPANCQVVGYARSKLGTEEFRKKVRDAIQHVETQKPPGQPGRTIQSFLDLCFYISGQYESPKDFYALRELLEEHESKVNKQGSTTNLTSPYRKPTNDVAVKSSQVSATSDKCANNLSAVRIIYLAVPPSVFLSIARNVKNELTSINASTGAVPACRLVIEKPFGKDYLSSQQMQQTLSEMFTENQLFRIDHYLGKEMVKHLVVFRFANMIGSMIYNRQSIANVQITFKEDFGTEKRGGYFDEYGIIRDVMQNHLMQILALVAMEKPISLDSENIRDEKTKVLRCISPVALEDVVLGQYTRSADGHKPGYLDDDTVPKNSLTATFACAVLYVNNERWDGVPFIIKCGKALDTRKTEIRLQFRDCPGNIFPNNLARNELVTRVSPDEAVYLKVMNKQPGIAFSTTVSELDLTYKQRFAHVTIPDAYESLLLDVLRNDQGNFVRSDELEAAWRIFTPLLHRIESERITPEAYTYGSRGPASADELLMRCGYIRSPIKYEWQPPAEEKEA